MTTDKPILETHLISETDPVWTAGRCMVVPGIPKCIVAKITPRSNTTLMRTEKDTTSARTSSRLLFLFQPRSSCLQRLFLVVLALHCCVSSDWLSLHRSMPAAVRV